MSLLKTIGIGQSGLRAANLGIQATSHNVANVNTPGYTRRAALTSTQDPLRKGNVWIGQGVSSDGLLRQSSHTLSTRLLREQGAAAQASTGWQALRGLERIYDGAERTTLPSTLGAFFDSLSAATQDPSDPALRSAVTSAAQALGTGFRSDARAFADARADQRSDLAAALPQVNADLAQVAKLNEAIAASRSGSLGAGDLIDQRDAYLTSLAEQAGVQVHFDADDVATVFIGGHAAVSGGEARTLALDPAAGEPRVTLSHSADKGIDVTDGLGGRAGARVGAWHEIDGRATQLDTLASSLADALNAAHGAGFDASGAPGGAVFAYSATDPAASLTIDPGLQADPTQWAFASSASALAGDIGALRTLIDLEQAPIVGGERPGDALRNLGAGLGQRIAELETLTQRHAGMADDLEETRQQLFGVDLDEEAANLMQYQAAYQASARVVTTSNDLVNTLLELVR